MLNVVLIIFNTYSFSIDNDSDPAIIVDNKAIDGDFYLLIGLFSLTLDHQFFDQNQ